MLHLVFPEAEDFLKEICQDDLLRVTAVRSILIQSLIQNLWDDEYYSSTLDWIRVSTLMNQAQGEWIHLKGNFTLKPTIYTLIFIDMLIYFHSS